MCPGVFQGLGEIPGGPANFQRHSALNFSRGYGQFPPRKRKQERKTLVLVLLSAHMERISGLPYVGFFRPDFMNVSIHLN